MLDLGDPTEGAHKIPESVRNRRRLAVGAGLSVGVALGTGATAQAAPFTVTNLDPSGAGSLADAVSLANGTTAADQILFQSGLTGTITLTTQLGISEPVTIDGPGAGALTVSGGGVDRVFYLATAGDPVTISGLTVTGGKAGSAGGGGILNKDAKLTVQSSAITGNNAVHSGVPGPAGGGIFSNTGATNQIKDSTISGNTAGNGAGINALTSSLFVVNTTIAGNDATGYGGGIWADGGLLAAYSSTIVGNSAAYGGGITSANHSPDPAVAGTVVAGNTANIAAERDLRNALGDPFTLVFSLVGTSPGAGNYTEFIAGSNIIGVDPQLGPLAANGGPTKTMRPALTSPLLDKSSSFALTDQRGSTRPVDLPGIANAPNNTIPPGDGADIGAVELTLAEATPPSAITTGTPSSVAPKKCKKKKKKGKKAAAAKKKCKKKKKKKK